MIFFYILLIYMNNTDMIIVINDNFPCFFELFPNNIEKKSFIFHENNSILSILNKYFF